MIIGFDGSRAFVKDRTGTENYSFHLLKNLIKIDKKNKYIVYVRKITKDWTAVQHNVIFREIRLPRLWTQVGLATQTFKDKLDVLFVPSHTLPIIRKPGLKTIMTVHDLGSEYLPETHQLKQRIYLGFMQKYQLKGASKIIAVSKATKKDLVERIGIKPGKIEVIYEGYDKSLFKPIKSDLLGNLLNQYELVSRKYFLFVGTVQPRKNLERLIKAFALHLRGVNKVKAGDHLGGGVKLVISGSKGWLADDIYRLPRRLDIENKVKFLGYVPDKDMPALYCGAVALLFPSLFEGFGLPILEAQACGCPVLTSNVSSMPEVAGKAALYVNPISVEDIIRGMIRIKNKELRIKLMKRGFENVKGFSWDKCAEETLEVFENL